MKKERIETSYILKLAHITFLLFILCINQNDLLGIGGLLLNILSRFCPFILSLFPKGN